MSMRSRSAGSASPGPVGLVINRPGGLLGLEPFVIELMEGIEEIFSPLDRSVLFNIANDHEQEIEIWRRWTTHGAVDALVMLDIQPDDDRLRALNELGVPAIVLGGPRGGLPFSNVYVDSAAGATQAVDALADLGHRRIAYIGGPHRLLHSQTRSETFLSRCLARNCSGLLLEGDYYAVSGRQTTEELLRLAEPPTAIFYDNVVMAVAGMGVLSDHRLGVPDDISVMVWDDTALSRLTSPGLSVVAVDVHALGTALATAVLAALDGAAVTTYDSPAPQVRLRGSTAPPPRSTTPMPS